MDDQVKRTLLATFLCFAILFGYTQYKKMTAPPPPPSQPTSQPTSRVASGDETPSSRPAVSRDTQIAATSSPAATPQADTTADADLRAVDADWAEPVVLGSDIESDANPFEYSVRVTPRGAGVEAVKLANYRNTNAADKKDPEPDPYDLLQPVTDETTHERFVSLVTDELRVIRGRDTENVDISNLIWNMRSGSDANGATAVFTTTISDSGLPVLGLRKTFFLPKDSDHLRVEIAVENLSAVSMRELVLVERGPVGIPKADPKMEYRRAVAAVIDDQGGVKNGGNATPDDVLKKPDSRYSLSPAKGSDEHLLWSAVGNKYFMCLLAPLPQPTDKALTTHPTDLQKLWAKRLIKDPADKEAPTDLTLQQEFARTEPLAAGQSWSIAYEVYCGPKSKKKFDDMPPALAARNYTVACNPDHSFCAPEVLAKAMLWLLTNLYELFGNYGVAIIILVVIVRTILHPITKRGQINMMKMQKGMAKLKPKLEAIQQQYKNDKQKLNEETMKVYREEGVNPMGNIFGCLPMFLQMPVWVALWTTLNTNVDMRHQPFCLWITDLSAPDALIPFSTSFKIPLLHAMMGEVHAFNLLPIVMTITMYLQQKFTQKLTKPAVPVTPKLDKDGKPLPDPTAQQQKIMSYMMIFFGFLFYNFPSGLNLYILSSNLLGMLEQWRIRKHINEQEEKGAFEPKKDVVQKKSGLAATIERLQKKAEEARLEQSGRTTNDKRKKKAPKP